LVLTKSVPKTKLTHLFLFIKKDRYYIQSTHQVYLMTTEIKEEIATTPIEETKPEAGPPWIYRDGYDQHYKVRYAGFTIDLDEWVANQKVS
jgi:hypothetical protein